MHWDSRALGAGRLSLDPADWIATFFHYIERIDSASAEEAERAQKKRLLATHQY